MTTTTYTHLSTEERQQIGLHLSKGYSLRSIATMLGRSHTSLSRELRRNSIKKGYDPPSAKVKTRVRRMQSKYQWMKIEYDRNLRSYVIEHLEQGWTPEMIAGRLKYCGDTWEEKYLDYISAKGIYHWLYSSWWQRYCKYLPSKRVKVRKKIGKKKKKREMIPNAVCITERSTEANKRKKVWHWEADTIVSGKKTKSKAALCTLVDRKSRYTKIYKMKDMKPSTMNTALTTSLIWLPCKTCTYDRGIENKWHEEIKKKLKCLTFFCHSYCSWEKGTNENTNGRIRRFVPKGCDINVYSDTYIQEVEDWLNHTPRKCLNYKTPYEVMREGIQSEKRTQEKDTKKTQSLSPNLTTWVC